MNEPYTERAGVEPPVPKSIPESDSGAAPHSYTRYPTHRARSRVLVGFSEIVDEVIRLAGGGGAIAVDGSPGVDWPRWIQELKRVDRDVPAEIVPAAALYLPERTIEQLAAPYLGGDDPLFGYRADLEMRRFLDAERADELTRRRSESRAALFVVGPGAAAALGDRVKALVYVELARNELQFRARAGRATNLFRSDVLPPKQAYKRSYFLDWPLLERELLRLWPTIDLFVDARYDDTPLALSGAALRADVRALTERPFRPRPWFEPGAWGGSWMKRNLSGLNPAAPNYAWSFELIAPENSVLFTDEHGTAVEVPLPLITRAHPERVIGPAHTLFNDEFPIRFDFLDTVEGGNLSLQCHPKPSYAAAEFGEPFTQIESYYIVEAEPDASVYLGLKSGEVLESFRHELERSAEEHSPVAVEEYVQRHPSKPHDLFLIPPGTVHSSGAGNVVLEISATPYIFTFKLYDWLRTDLDGKPRPLNIERGFLNLDPAWAGAAVVERLIPRPVVISEADAVTGERLPTTEEHFYEIYRYTFHSAGNRTGAGHPADGAAGERPALSLGCDGSPLVCMVVAGGGVRWRCGGHSAIYRFAETFIVPAAAETVELTPMEREKAAARGAGPVVLLVARLKSALKRERDGTIRSSP